MEFLLNLFFDLNNLQTHVIFVDFSKKNIFYQKTVELNKQIITIFR